MIDIKFRGQRTDTKEWVYGYLCFYGDGYFINNGKLLNNSGKDWRIKADEVIPETVGQYTGLKDKNNKEIYKDDIVNEYGFYSPCIVRFGEYVREAQMNGDFPRLNLGFYLEAIPHRSNNGVYYNFGNKSILDTNDGLEVIGNIYNATTEQKKEWCLE